MKKINYKVNCDSSKIKEGQSSDKNYVINKFIAVIKRRRELSCYEKRRTM